jgi:hypothetical protein
MLKNRSHPLRRNLLAVCTFLVPLGVLAWLGQSELRRQSAQARGALDREALLLLRNAASNLEQQLDELLAEMAVEARGLLAEDSPAVATRGLRQRGFGAALDILLLDSTGQLIHPRPDNVPSILPFSADASSRFAREQAEMLHLADLLITRQEYEQAERHLQAATEKSFYFTRRGSTQIRNHTELLFRLATVQKRLQRDEASDTFAEAALSSTPCRPWDSTANSPSPSWRTAPRPLPTCCAPWRLAGMTRSAPRRWARSANDWRNGWLRRQPTPHKPRTCWQTSPCTCTHERQHRPTTT